MSAEVAAGVFAHGFLAATTPLRLAGLPDWRRTRVGGLHLAVHPTTDVAEVALGGDRAPAGALLGQAVDLDTPSTRSAVVLRRLLRAVERGGLDAGTRYASRIGGRWAAVVTHGGTTHVVQDSHAAQSVYWTDRAGRVVVASHAALCAEEAGAETDTDTLEAFGRIREVKAKGTVFLPGARTPFVGVRPVIASCRLEITPSGTARHRRYAPLGPRVERPARSRDVLDEFTELFDRHVRLLARFGRTGQSLTAGGDSEVTLAALLRARPPGLFTFTYVNPSEVARNDAVVTDMFGASRRAFDAGLPHRLIRWRLPEPGDPFDEVVTRMWPHLRPSIGAAHAMYRDLPRGFYEMQSTVSETGTIFYRRRTDEPPTAQRLTTLWAGAGAARRPEFVEAFEEYIEYAEFTEDALQGYDHHDLFYWEHRNSRWAAEKYQLGDVGHRVLLPFNARPIIETMLSLPEADRSGKWLLTQYLERRRPGGDPLLRAARGLRRRARKLRRAAR